MFAEIVPFLRLSRSLPVFSYSVPDTMHPTIKRGVLVNILFRNKKVLGCVVRVTKTARATSRILPITEILPLPPIPEQTLTLLEWVARITCTHPGIVFKDVLPTPLKRKRKPSDSIPEEKRQLSLKRSSLATLKKSIQLIAAHPKESFLLFEHDRAYTYTLVIKRIEYAIEHQTQLLVLFPTHELLLQFTAYLPMRLEKNIVILHAQLTKTEYWSAWQQTLNGASVIIGTRSAVFAPGNWSEIIITDEENASYKQEDQNPRYSTHDILAHIRKGSPCSLIATSVAPRVTTHSAATAPIILPSPVSPFAVRILDMRGAETSDGIIHKELLSAITRVAQNRARTILFVPRLGYAGYMQCDDCGTRPSCTMCGRVLQPYLVDAVTHTYTLHCHACTKEQAVPSICPKCRGVRFDFHGLGSERLASILSAIFSPQAMQYITIATHPPQEVFTESIKLVAVVSCETLLHHPDIRSGEWTYQWLLKIRSFASSHGLTSLTIQSWTPEHHAIQGIVHEESHFFYEKEKNIRCDFLYPPFVRSAVCFIKTNKKDDGIMFANQLLDVLQMTNKTGTDILVSEPYSRRTASPGIHATSLYFRQSIHSPEEQFIDLLANIPEPWIIDREPERIF